jgi:capsular exopolysaccharide synthesis family protein
MGSPSWIVSCPPEPSTDNLPQAPVVADELVRAPAFPYSQAVHGIQLEAPGVVPGYARNIAPPPITVGLLRGLKTRWKSALLLGLILGSISAAAMAYLNPPKYTTKAFFRVEASEPSVFSSPGERGAVGGQGDAAVVQNDYLNLVKQPAVLRAALDDPKLHELKLLRLHQADQLGWLQDELKATIPERTDLMVLSLSGQEPNELATILTAVTDAFTEKIINQEKNQKRKDILDIQGILESSQRDVNAKKEILVRIMRNDLQSSASEIWVQRQRHALEKYHTKDHELTALRGNFKAAKLKLESLGRTARKPEEIQPPEFQIQEQVDADPRVVSSRNKILDIVAKLDQFKSRAQNPSGMRSHVKYEKELKEAEEELENLKKKARETITRRLQMRLASQAELARTQAQDQANSLESQIQEVEAEVEDLREEAEQVGVRSVEAEAKRAELDDKERVLKDLRQRQEKLNAEFQSKKQRVKLVTPAYTPELPDYKMWAVFTAVAGLLGLILGVVGVAFREYRADKINSSAQVTKDLGLRVVGSLPPLSGKMLGGRLSNSRRDVFDQSLLIESIDGIRTMLLCDEQVDAKRILMITSANAREGKTMLASHLAGSIARTGRKTLLIDCDLRRPGIHRLFDVSESPGMSEVLRKQIEPADAVRPTRLDNLYILAAGKCDREAVEALARQSFPDLLSKLRTEFDFIIVDSCPILPVPDALLISKHVDAVVLSIRPTVSHAASVFAACERLQAMGVPLLGTVVNGDRAHANGLEYKSLLQT